MIALTTLNIMVLIRFCIFIIFVSIIAIFPLSNCTGGSDSKLDERREDIGDEEEDSFSSSRRYSRRSSSRRSSSTSSTTGGSTTGGSTTGGSTTGGSTTGGSTTGGIHNPYHPEISRNPTDEDGRPIPPRGSFTYDANGDEIPENDPCKGNLLWLRENCNRLPTWLDQAESSGYEKVEITSRGTVIWHWGIFFGTWRGDTWKGGSFFGGIWERGVWEHGFWKNGEFRSGTWENGNWCDGIFSGTWEFGEWQNGIFRGRTWEDGWWNYGLWEASNSNWDTGICYTATGRSQRTDDSPAHQNSLCRNQLYEDIHGSGSFECDRG